jgi:low affinity Fe/Cu permease
VKLDELIRVSKANNAFMGLKHVTVDIEGKDEGRAVEARQASTDAKHNLRVIEGDG